jgi:hypothetical protein
MRSLPWLLLTTLVVAGQAVRQEVSHAPVKGTSFPKIQLNLKDGLAFDASKLIESVRGQVGIRKNCPPRPCPFEGALIADWLSANIAE